ncbi:MAG: acetylxylan esterase [Chitinispirillaceae bacterium]
MKFQTGFTSANFLILFIFLSTTSAQTSAFSGYDTAGPYSAERIRDTGPDGTYDVFRPEFSGNEGEEHAIITWGNGTGATPTAYAGLLHHLATHGFVVIASQSTATGSGSEMAAGADWLLEENARTGSEYYQKLNSRAAGATGHSQGGAGTIQSLQHTDKITSIAPLAPATFDSPFFYSTSHVDVPMFIMLGSDDNLANPTSIRTMSWGTFESDKAGLYGELDGADHFEPGGDGGMFRKYVTAWFDATLNSSQDAVAMISIPLTVLCIRNQLSGQPCCTRILI